MRVLGVLAAWGVLAVLATMCFALGGSIGYRRGVRDTLAQIRERRAGKAGCRPLPANHLRRRSSGHLRPGARARRARWRTGPSSAPVAVAGVAPKAGSTWSVLTSSGWTSAVAACVAVLLLIGVPATAVGASTAAPGDRMYGAKLALGEVRLAAAIGPERKAQTHVDLARARLVELSLLDAGDVDPAVVHRVVDEVEAHYAAVEQQVPQIDEPEMRDTLERDMAAVISSQDTVVTTMVAGAGCEQRTDGACGELAQTQRETAALQSDSAQTTGVVASDKVVVASADVVIDGEEVDADGAGTATAGGELDGDAAASQQDDTGTERKPKRQASGGDPAASDASAVASPARGTDRKAADRAASVSTAGKATEKAGKATKKAGKATTRKAGKATDEGKEAKPPSGSPASEPPTSSAGVTDPSPSSQLGASEPTAPPDTSADDVEQPAGALP